MDWAATAERQRERYEATEKPVLRGNAAYGAALAHLMGRQVDDARAWFERAASAWRESWSDATPTSWGRPIGATKALLLAGDEEGAADAAEWALSLGCEEAESPIGRYAAALALLTLGRFEDARAQANVLRARDDFPADVADALAFVAAHDPIAYAEAADAVLTSFETRDEYLEDVPVADTLLVLQVLAARRGIAADVPESPVLPA